MPFYNIYNPTQARRIIYDGITNERRIEIMPGQSLEHIELSDQVAANLFAVSSKIGKDKELMLSEVKAGVEATTLNFPDQEAAKAMPLKIDEAGVTVIKAKSHKPVVST